MATRIYIRLDEVDEFLSLTDQNMNKLLILNLEIKIQRCKVTSGGAEFTKSIGKQ